MTRDGQPRSTIKAKKSTVARLKVLARGAEFPTLDALLDHLAALAAQRPELLKAEARKQ